jgi:hypothetical protein
LSLNDYRGSLNVYAGVRSLWTGRAELAGRSWQIGVIDSLQARRGDAGIGHMLLRPWEDRGAAFSVGDDSLSAFPFATNLFLQTQSYAVDCKRSKQGEELRCELLLRPQSAKLGELELSGKFIQRLQLRDGQTVVVLDAPAETVRVPVGRYGEQQVRLGQGKTVVHLERPYGQKSEVLVVSDDKPAKMIAGGPLTNTVSISRRGQQLVFSYRLVGPGDKTYQLAGADRGNPPQFAVYQGDKKIASGKFEFG